jgi:Fic family protein
MYNSAHQFTPLMPADAKQEALLVKAHELVIEALRLPGQPAAELRNLLRGMNSYYSNRIEGQHTRPLELEQALRRDFSAEPELAARQRMALAHMDAERALEIAYPDEAAIASIYQMQTVQAMHTELFKRLPQSDLVTADGEIINPGQLRQRDVQVGQHVAPAFAALPNLLQAWGQQYSNVRRGEKSLLAVAAAHHRLGWIHPFIDGNGRVMRLHTHAVMHALGYTRGIWSPLRGFARNQQRYFAMMADADSPRRGDLDGRGNLSEQALVNWIDFVLEICLDQARFMSKLLAFGQMKARIAACLSFEEEVQKSGVRRAALTPLNYLFMDGGEIERGEFKLMMGLGERTSGTVLAALLERSLLKSDTPQGKLRFAFPLHALRFYFPAMWPEAEADAA